MRLQKVLGAILFVAFFLWLHFAVRSWIIGADAVWTVCNQGGPFGILLPSWLFLCIGIGAGIFFLVQWLKEESWITEWPWLALVAGGLGNLLERQLFGCIMDYIALSPLPVFNVADILLTVGVVGILWSWYLKRKENG
ncbi:MAG: hypothetical protein A3E38_00775 [Candidatus Moranbacteria bacterium RIFCSPHIGHO2_12_FULL_54_9]|nr:MAG: hypothetical protein A3E38_00775 [Candidatus Moranbacteria bacterium RIFCSPHIGHO2_12_FULL_54_9]